jgi:hypothetical protein
MSEQESKPDDIPEDVWATARASAFGETGDMETDINILVARAILAERERCVKIADAFPMVVHHPAGPAYGAGFAAAVQQMRIAILATPPAHGERRQ